MARPPLATQRLSETRGDELIYTMKRVFSDGTSAILLSPEELLEKLATNSRFVKKWSINANSRIVSNR
jgi:hypothetical protein